MTTKRACLLLSFISFLPYVCTFDSVYMVVVALFFCTWNILCTVDRAVVVLTHKES